MTGSFGKRACLLLFVVFAAFPAVGYAQDAVLTGTITDATGGVLPGVTVTAVNEATGNSFVSVTDGTGTYRIPVRVGGYRVTAELQGFTTVQRTGVRLLVGETIGVSLQMSPSTIQETVTVTAEAPLIEVNTSSLGGNIDPRAGAGAAGAGPQLDGAGAARARQPDHAWQRRTTRCRTATAARCASSSSTSTVSRSRRTSAPACSRATARTRSPSSSSSRTGSTPRWDGRPACR